jgi:hypothetical protein
MPGACGKQPSGCRVPRCVAASHLDPQSPPLNQSPATTHPLLSQALQEPLGMALGVLEEIECFRQALVSHDVARVGVGEQPCEGSPSW